MGKASRMKKERQQGSQSQTDFQKEASRQANERRRQEVERHNASCGQAREDLPETEEILAMEIDGKFHFGKAAISEVYASWINNEIAKDDIANLDEIAALGEPMRCSIWDVKVEVIDLDDGSAELLDPLRATFAMDKSNCFEWLADHAFHSTKGTQVLLELFRTVLTVVHTMDEKSERYRLATLLMRKLFNRWLDACESENTESEITERLDKLARLVPLVGEVFMEVIGERASSRERQEIEASLLECGEPNLEAIKQSHQATLAKGGPTHAKIDSLRL